MTGTVCSVASCRSKYELAKKTGERIRFFRFPKDPKIRKEWVRRCYRKDKFSPQNTRICDKHFKNEDYKDSLRAKLLGIKATYLKETAIPSLFLKLPGDVEETVSGQNNQTAPVENRACEELTVDIIPVNNSVQLDEDTIRMLCAHSNSLTVQLEGIDSKQNKESITISNELCRLCLTEMPNMWSFFSVLTFEDHSTLDVEQAFQYVTEETAEQIKEPTLPQYICKVCLDLLVNAYTFRQKYETSRKILLKHLSKESESDNDNAEPHSDDTGKRNSDFLYVKREPGVNGYVSDKSNEILAEENPTFNTDTENKEPGTFEKLHRCPICLKKFTALDLKQHVRSHKALKSYLNAAPKFKKKVRFYAKPRDNNVCLFNRDTIYHPCPFCAEEFTGEEFRDHVKQHREEGNFRCSVCNRVFLRRNHLKMHQLSHKQEAPFSCQDCGKSFFQQKNFEFHRLQHTASDDLPFKCQYCLRAFSNPEHLKRHNFGHEKSISYQKYYNRTATSIICKHCRQKFKAREALDRHRCRFCCAKCHKIFETKKEFVAHVCKHRLKPSKCPPCGKVFQLSTSYKAHKYRCTYRTLCYVCGKNVANMTQHLLSHYPHKRKIFTCADCGKQFRSKDCLGRHVSQVHMNLIPFYCQFCSKGFKSKWNLIVHERIHLGVKKHVCNICDKGFLEKSYLNKHLQVHLKKEGVMFIGN